MKSIDTNELTDNLFEFISKGWMLVTAGSKDAFNTMTANWGGVSFLWNKPMVYVSIRPERYAFDLIQNNGYFTLSFLGQGNKVIHKMYGSKSECKVDEVKETGLKPIITNKGNVLFEQGRLNMKYRKMYTDVLKKEDFLDPSVHEQ